MATARGTRRPASELTAGLSATARKGARMPHTTMASGWYSSHRASRTASVVSSTTSTNRTSVQVPTEAYATGRGGRWSLTGSPLVLAV
jgi:hypothetical protein